MSELARAVGAPVTISLAGRQYLLSPLTLGDIGTIQNHLRQKLPDVLHQAGQAAVGLPDATAQLLVREALAEMKRLHRISIEEAIQWATATLEGLAFTFWVLLEKRYPQHFTAESMLQLFSTMTMEELGGLSRTLMVSGGVDAVGEATGPTTATPADGPHVGEKSSTPCAPLLNSVDAASTPTPSPA